MFFLLLSPFCPLWCDIMLSDRKKRRFYAHIYCDYIRRVRYDENIEEDHGIKHDIYHTLGHTVE